MSHIARKDLVHMKGAHKIPEVEQTLRLISYQGTALMILMWIIVTTQHELNFALFRYGKKPIGDDQRMLGHSEYDSIQATVD